MARMHQQHIDNNSVYMQTLKKNKQKQRRETKNKIIKVKSYSLGRVSQFDVITFHAYVGILHA